MIHRHSVLGVLFFGFASCVTTSHPSPELQPVLSESAILQNAVEVSHTPASKAGSSAYKRAWGWEVVVVRDLLEAETVYVELSPSGKLLCEVASAPSEPPTCRKQW